MYDLSWLNPTPHAIAVYASQPLSPAATQHSLPSGRYSLLGPDLHRLDRTSLRLAHFYSITSSARARRVGGTSSPSALAAFKLITNSYFCASHLPSPLANEECLAAVAQTGSNAVDREMDALHDPLVGSPGAMALEQLDLNMIERVDIRKAVAYRAREQGILLEQRLLLGDGQQRPHGSPHSARRRPKIASRSAGSDTSSA